MMQRKSCKMSSKSAIKKSYIMQKANSQLRRAYTGKKIYVKV